MTILKRGSITYYVKDEVVVVGIGTLQYLAYTVYPLQNRKPFYDFRRAILKSNEDEYATPSALIALGRKYNLKGVASHKPAGVDK